MLGQLICLDRRYQRMNCFNIREAQSLLKKRFFVDLITSNDHHTLLDKTMLGLRFKTLDLNSIHPNGKLISNFGLSRLLSSRVINSKFTETSQAFTQTNSLPYFFMTLADSYSGILTIFTKLVVTTSIFLDQPTFGVKAFFQEATS